MKILILLKKIPGGVGGGVKNIKNELTLLGHKVDFISREEDLKIYSFLGSILKIRSLVKRLMKKENYDVIYTQDWSLAAPLLLPYPLFKKKHFCMFHGNQLGKLKIIQNTIGKLMGRHLLVMAPSLKRRFPKASINYCGVSLEKFKDMKKKRKYLGWISKGTEILKKEELEILSKKLDLPLLVASGLKHEEMNDKFYSLCKVFISMPPASAGFQASWLESMTAGVPIVIGNDNGAGEVQPFPKVPQEKEHDLNFIANLIKSQKGTNYVSWVKQNNFTWKRHSENLIKIFNKI